MLSFWSVAFWTMNTLQFFLLATCFVCLFFVTYNFKNVLLLVFLHLSNHKQRCSTWTPRRLEMSNISLFLPHFAFCHCLTTPFFLASYVLVFIPFQWIWRGKRSDASNVMAGESLSRVAGSVYRVNQSCTNPWLPLTFTGASISN